MCMEDVFTGSIEGLGALVNNITQSLEELHTVLDAVPTAIVLVDATNKLMYLNKCGMEFFEIGYSCFEMERYALRLKVLNPDGTFFPLGEWPISRSLEKGQIIHNVKMIIQNAHKKQFDVSVSSAPLCDSRGCIKGAIGIFENCFKYGRQENVLKENEQLYRILFENTKDGFIQVEPVSGKDDSSHNFRILRVNAAWEQQTGLRADDFIGKSIKGVLPDAKYSWCTIFAKVLTTGRQKYFEYYDTGTGLWYGVRAFLYHAGQVGVLFRNITRCKKMEEAMWESEEGKRFMLKLEELLQDVEDPREIQKATFETVGCTRMAVECARAGTALRKSEGHARKLVRELQTVKNELTAEVEALLKLHKISKLVLSQDNKQNVFYSILETAIDLTFADKGNIQIFDENTNTRGFIAHKGFKKPFLDYFANTTVEAGSCGVSFREKRPTVVEDVQKSPIFVGKPDMHYMMEEEVYACQSTPMVSSTGNIIGILSTHYRARHIFNEREIRMLEIFSRWAADIIEINIAHETLQKSEQRALALVKDLENIVENKNQFLSVLSHELRNPLATISAGLQMLDLTKDESQITEIKGIMNRQMNQLCHLVDDLLDLARIENNKIRLDIERVEITKLVESVAKDNRLFFEVKGLELKTQITCDALYLDADPTRIKQIIGNLLHNSMKFTDKGGRVSLTVSKEDTEVVICVEDNGEGMEPEILKQLFEPFIQADESLDRCKGGLGLGLSIVKGIVHLHGGTVNAFSAGPGKGSSFYIRLPIVHQWDA